MDISSDSESDSGSDCTSSSESEEPEMDAINLLNFRYQLIVCCSRPLTSQIDIIIQEEIHEKLREYLEVGNLFLQKAGVLA